MNNESIKKGAAKRIYRAVDLLLITEMRNVREFILLDSFMWETECCGKKATCDRYTICEKTS